jgi:hypothetical protein
MFLDTGCTARQRAYGKILLGESFTLVLSLQVNMKYEGIFNNLKHRQRQTPIPVPLGKEPRVTNSTRRRPLNSEEDSNLGKSDP